MKKCIDASISIFKVGNLNVTSVGSHSGIIYNININTLELISELRLADRIESQISLINPHFGIVGCYDGNIYCFDIFKGEIMWKFFSKGMIKCKPLIVENKVIFGNYNREMNLWCIDNVKYYLCQFFV